LFDHQNDPLIVSGKKNLVSEQYDEMVFTDPSNTMYHLLTNIKTMIPAIRHEPGTDCKGLAERGAPKVLFKLYMCKTECW